MKKVGNCDQCHERHELNNRFKSMFHRHFKYRNFLIKAEGHFRDISGYDMYICHKCQIDVMRAMKDGYNWE